VSSGSIALDDARARGGRVAWLARLERLAPALLAAGVLLWVLVVFAASIYKYETFGQGYDQVDFEQAIWNTVQGHPMEDSRFNFTASIFGMDWMPMLLFFVPFYALIPSPHTLIFLHIVGAGLGVAPLYLLARERLGSGLAGVGAGLVYLLYPTLLYGVMNPFQLRLFAVTLLLFAFYYFERGNWKLFAASVLLAMLARTDVALVVAMFGPYALLTRRKWEWVTFPLVAGFGYFALSTFVIVPSFIHPDALQGPSGPLANPMDCWPCGHNPMLAYYGHLGGTFGEIARYIVTHPLEVAALVFTGPKLLYIVSLLLPLGFLPLLSPKPLVLALPILALNLLSERQSQFEYDTHYSLLLIPGLMAAGIYGASALAGFLARRSGKQHGSGAAARYGLVIVLGLVGLGVVLQVPYKNPMARAVLYSETPERVQAARELVGMVPPEAKVAASSFVAPHLLPRRYIYNFPPAPYSPYNFGTWRQSPRFAELDYIMVDPAARGLAVNPIGGRNALDLLREMPEWRQIASREGYLLFKREP
jgi:uncharacterized membrane protein